MTATRGVYFLANDRVIELAIAFLNSFRAHNPNLPLCLIPFRDDTTRLTRLGEQYGFSVYSNHEVLRRCDAIAKRFHDGSAPGHYRKLGAWNGEFDEFAYIDVDTVVLQSIDFAFSHLADWDFLTSHSNQPGLERWVWKPAIRSTGKLSEAQIAFSANTGFIVSRRRSFDWPALERAVEGALEMRPYLALVTMEQPLLNYWMVTSGQRYTSLYSLDPTGVRIPREWWGGRRGAVSFRGMFRCARAPSMRIFLVHWAGVWRPRPIERRWFAKAKALGLVHEAPILSLAMRYRRLWRYYRSLEKLRTWT